MQLGLFSFARRYVVQVVQLAQKRCTNLRKIVLYEFDTLVK